MNKKNLDELAEFRGCLWNKRTFTARRRYEEDEDMLVPGIDPFLIDAELKIACSKAVRRMLDKTQVLTNPQNLHIRKRITHAGEVTSIASFIAALSGLNIELAKAIALGHDIGHPPFGHDGEAFLNVVCGRGHVFRHEIMGVVIAQHIERCGQGLNLTHEVLSGIMRDAWPKDPDGSNEKKSQAAMSEEAKVVMWADRFAYLTGDYNDTIRIGYPIPKELEDLMNSLGSYQRARVNNLVMALMKESAAFGSVSFCQSGTAEIFAKIRELMYGIYPMLNASNSESILGRIYEFVEKVFRDIDPVLVIALMTDSDAIQLASQPVLDYSHLSQVTVVELLPMLREKQVEWWDPDLDW